MKKADIPPITASTYVQAQELVRKYGLGQWRSTAYIKALIELPTKDVGKYATDHNIARFIDDKRTRQSARGVMQKLVRQGIARERHETESGGFAYEKAEQAYTEIKQIERNWLAVWESQIEPERPEYVNWFEKKNSELKALRAEKDRTTEELRADKEQLVGTIATQQQLIGSQAREIEYLKAEVERLKKAAGEGANPERVPFPL